MGADSAFRVTAGAVDINALSERGRNNYFFARTAVGRDFALPEVQACNLH